MTADSNSSLWPLGVLIYVAGTFGESLGANLQRKSILRERAQKEEDESYEELPKFKQRTWKVGFFMFVGAGICMSLALFFASQTLLAPLQLFLFISNVIFANLINREPFNWFGKDGMATAFVIIGVIMCVVSAPKATHDLTDDEMIVLMQKPGFISFCVCAFLLIVFLFVTKREIMKGCNGDPRTIPQRWKRTYLNMSYGALAGAFGGVNVTLTKTTFALLEGEFKEGGMLGILSSPLLWGVALTLICTYVGQMWVTVNALASRLQSSSSHRTLSPRRWSPPSAASSTLKTTSSLKRGRGLCFPSAISSPSGPSSTSPISALASRRRRSAKRATRAWIRPLCAMKRMGERNPTASCRPSPHQ